MVGAVSTQFSKVVEEMLDARRCGANSDRYWCSDGTDVEAEEEEEDINELPSNVESKNYTVAKE